MKHNVHSALRDITATYRTPQPYRDLAMLATIVGLAPIRNNRPIRAQEMLASVHSVTTVRSWPVTLWSAQRGPLTTRRVWYLRVSARIAWGVTTVTPPAWDSPQDCVRQVSIVQGDQTLPGLQWRHLVVDLVLQVRSTHNFSTNFNNISIQSIE